MRIFETKAVYDFENSEWIEIYLIDGKEIDFEDYCNEQEAETIEDEFECNGDCENCCEDDEETIGEMIEDYVEMIQDVSPCPCCIQELLESFYDEIMEKLEEE